MAHAAAHRHHVSQITCFQLFDRCCTSEGGVGPDPMRPDVLLTQGWEAEGCPMGNGRKQWSVRPWAEIDAARILQTTTP